MAKSQKTVPVDGYFSKLIKGSKVKEVKKVKSETTKKTLSVASYQILDFFPMNVSEILKLLLMITFHKSAGYTALNI